MLQPTLYGQKTGQQEIYRSPVRKVLNMFSVNFSTGYGYSPYKHSLEGFYFLQVPEGQFILPSSTIIGDEVTGYSSWINNPQVGEPVNLRDPFEIPRPGLDRPVNNPLLISQTFLVNADTSALGFRGSSHMVPVLLSLHFNFAMVRAGLGYQVSQEYMGNFKPTMYEDKIRPLSLDFNTAFQRRFFGLIGVKFYEWYNYGFVAEAQFGSINPGRNFDPAVAQFNSFINIGLSIEKSISEYVRFTFRPSYDIRSYTVTLPEGQGQVAHKNPSLMFQAGLSVNFPEIPRTPMRSDHVQLKHLYTDPETGRRMEVRGQPIWRWQNPKIGQNHRKIVRDRGKNRRKMNPY